MSETCRVMESGFAAEGPFAAAGDHLDVQMLRTQSPISLAAGKEAMFAVIEGTLELRCGDDGEAHDLAAGEGLLVPAYTPVELTPSAPVLLYVVRAK